MLAYQFPLNYQYNWLIFQVIYHSISMNCFIFNGNLNWISKNTITKWDFLWQNKIQITLKTIWILTIRNWFWTSLTHKLDFIDYYFLNFISHSHISTKIPKYFWQFFFRQFSFTKIKFWEQKKIEKNKEKIK